MKKSLFLSVALVAMASVSFAEAPYPQSGDQTVCISSQPYGVEEVAGSTYTWTFSGTDAQRTITDGATSGFKSVDWLAAGSYTITVQEKSADECLSEPSSITVTVTAKPVVDPVTESVCSGDVIGVTLPVKDKSAAALTQWTLKSVDVPAGVTADSGNVPTGTTTSASYIANDKYTNTSGADKQVIYTFTANGGGCESEEFTITVTVHKAVPTPTIYHN